MYYSLNYLAYMRKSTSLFKTDFFLLQEESYPLKVITYESNVLQVLLRYLYISLLFYASKTSTYVL
jgi:hypothetical protein